MILNTPSVDANRIHARFSLDYPDAKGPAFSLDVDVTVPGNGITIIFGQSGSGKTTFLRCVAGLEKPDRGRLAVNGDIWQSETTFLPTHKRPLGYVFQESSLFPHLTAKGNLAYALKRSGSAVTSELYDRVMGIMGIEPVLQRYPDRLSGGERQRVAIARALLIQPRLLLMDEPLASLDAARKQEILPYLERLRSTFDIPVLYVSHAMDEVARLADHTVVLDQGRVVAQGNLTEVFSRIDLPMRFGDETGVVLKGRVVERDTRWHLSRVAFDGGELWVRDGGDALDRWVRVRVLAKDVSLALASHGDTSILNRLPVEVAELSQDQDEAIALVRLKTGPAYLIARVTQRSVHQLKLEPGKRLWAQIKSVAIVR
ncbi:molybdenum ABC transporter ATP-binding protein [Sulfidibacter corallicola]